MVTTGRARTCSQISDVYGDMFQGIVRQIVKHVLAILIIAVLVEALSSSDAAASKRVALVIGNSSYETVPTLPNPANDARDVALALERLQFSVTLALDLPSAGLRAALRDFGHTANGADTAVVFFAGHGMEIAKQNFLIPVDAKLRTDLDVYYEGVPLDLVTAAVGGAKGLRLVLLDACRNNPFSASMQSTSAKRSIGRGLSRIEPPSGLLVSYAAKEGTTADDGD